MARVDLTIRGAGIFGLSIAWEATRRGARVQVIDPRGPGGGASGGVVGALAPHVPENWNAKKAFQLECLLSAESWWADVAKAGGGNPGYARTGRVQPVPEGGLDLARARAEGAARLWQGRAEWVVERAEGDWLPASPTGWVIRDTLSARIHPRRAVMALAAALRAKGAEIVTDSPEDGPVIHATGWEGLRALSEDLGQPVGNGVKGQAALLKYASPDAPQLFADALHIVPHADGTTAIGSTSEREFGDPAGTDDQLDDIIARARTAVPALADAEVITRWAGVRPRARSRAPMLGPWPGRAGHFIANGGFKIGFGMAPGIARVMADLVLEGRDEVPEGFRFTDNLPRGGAPNA